MKFIIESLKNVQKKILTSATDAVEIPDFIGLKNPERINFLTPGEETEGLAIKSVFSDDKDKSETLFKLMCYLGNRSTIVFCNHREAVERTSKLLSEKGIYNEFYHGGMEQQQRDSALSKFRNGTTNVLVTTDLASRGIGYRQYPLHCPLSFATYRRCFYTSQWAHSKNGSQWYGYSYIERRRKTTCVYR